MQFAAQTSNAIPVHVISEDRLKNWLKDQDRKTQNWVETNGFGGALGQALIVPAHDGAPDFALIGFGNSQTRSRGRFHIAAAAAKLPKGTYDLVDGIPSKELTHEALGWLLQSYQFNRYKSTKSCLLYTSPSPRDRG